MKSLLMLVLLAAALLSAAPAARAWEIRNHLDYEVGVKGNWSFGFDKYRIKPKSTLLGQPWAGLQKVFVSYVKQGDYFESSTFSIPPGGSALVFGKEVRIFDAGHKLVNIVGMLAYTWR